MECINNDHNFFKINKNLNDEAKSYRRGLLLSRIQTPASPLVCKMILPDPLAIDSISKIQKNPFLCVSYSSVLPCISMIEEYHNKSQTNKSLVPFVNYENSITLFTINNPFIQECKIENGNFVFYVNSSKYELDLHTTKKIIQIIKPSISIIPCELMKMNKVGKISTRKRNRVIDQYKTYCDDLKDSFTYTHIMTINHPVLNYDSDYLNLGSDLFGFGYGETLGVRADLINEMINKMKENELRILQLTSGTPLEILHSILIGIDVVVSPYPEILSSQGKALCFNIPDDNKVDIDIESVLKLLNENCEFIDGVYIDKTNSYIDLNESVYSNDIHNPIHIRSIRKESRSYVHHLLQCKEMSAEIILSSHNLWMYEMFFEKIRECIDRDTIISFVYNFIKANVK